MYIYTSSVFCYNEHKVNFDIHSLYKLSCDIIFCAIYASLEFIMNVRIQYNFWSYCNIGDVHLEFIMHVTRSLQYTFTPNLP